MAKILESASINGAVQKMLETNTGYIINGVFYDKSQLIPKPLKFYPIMGDHTALSMNSKLLLKYSSTIHRKSVGNTIITDRYNPTITYVFSVNTKSNTHSLFKLKEVNGDCEIINRVDYGSTPASYPVLRAYCGQDETFLYYLIDGGGTYVENLVKIDKITLTVSVIESFGSYSWGNPIKETEDYIYYARKTGYGISYIKRYGKITGLIEDFKVLPRTTTIYYSTNYSELLSENETKFETISLSHNKDTNKYYFVKYNFDLSKTVLTDIIKEEELEVEWNDEVNQIPVLSSSCNNHYEIFLTDFNGKNYLNVAIYDVVGTSTTNASKYGIYTFLIEPVTRKLIYKGVLGFGSDLMRGFVSVKNNTFLTIATDNTTSFANFDGSEKFIITDSIANQPVHIGVDQAENIWVVNALNEVEMFSPFVANNIDIQFEKPGYSYQGSDISSYITLEAKNFLGQNIKCNLQLTIKGNAVFTDNGTKSISIDTNSDGIIQIPITIKDKGNLSIASQLLI